MFKKLGKDEERWVTVKPNGPQHKGSPVKIDTETGKILGGMGGKFNGGTFEDIAMTKMLERLAGITKPRPKKSQTVKGMSKKKRAIYNDFMRLSREDVKKAKAKSQKKKKTFRNYGRDSVAMDGVTNRRIDENGFLHVADCRITKEQVAPYRGFEIPDWDRLGLDPDKIYYGYRPMAELVKALETLNGLPLMLDHVVVDSENTNKQRQIGSLGTSARTEAPYIVNDIVITDQAGIDALNGGEFKDLSLAYFYEPIFKGGNFEGVPYDFVMTNIRGNHLALVKKGRAGGDVVVADSSRNLLRGFKDMLKNLFRGAFDSDEEKDDIVEDEDKGAKIAEIVQSLAGLLDEEQQRELADALNDLVYSDATGDDVEEDDEIAREVDKKEAEKFEADNRALDALKACSMDEADDKEKAAFVKGFEYGTRDGEKLEKDEPKKLDREHERDGEEKALAKDSIRALEQSIAARFIAARDVEPSVGVVNAMAFDSADAIYQHALALMGRDVSRAAARHVYKAVVDTTKALAMDSIRAGKKSYSGAFEGLNNIKGA